MVTGYTIISEMGRLQEEAGMVPFLLYSSQKEAINKGYIA